MGISCAHINYPSTTPVGEVDTGIRDTGSRAAHNRHRFKTSFFLRLRFATHCNPLADTFLYTVYYSLSFLLKKRSGNGLHGLLGVVERHGMQPCPYAHALIHVAAVRAYFFHN